MPGQNDIQRFQLECYQFLSILRYSSYVKLNRFIGLSGDPPNGQSRNTRQ